MKIRLNNQARWKYLKYKIRKLSIKFSKLKTKITTNECTANYLDNSEYITCKSKLDKLYVKQANSTRIRGKCDWCEYSQKIKITFT